MSILVYGAAELRRALCFTDLPRVRTETVATAERAVRDNEVLIAATAATEPLWRRRGCTLASTSPR